MYSKIRNSDKLDWDGYIESLPNNPLGQRPTISPEFGSTLAESVRKLFESLWQISMDSWSRVKFTEGCVVLSTTFPPQRPPTACNRQSIECQKFSNCEPESPLGLIKGHRVAGVSHQNQPQVAALGWVWFSSVLIISLDFDKLINRNNEKFPSWIWFGLALLSNIFLDFDTFNIEVKLDSDQNQGRVASPGWGWLRSIFIDFFGLWQASIETMNTFLTKPASSCLSVSWFRTQKPDLKNSKSKSTSKILQFTKLYDASSLTQ